MKKCWISGVAVLALGGAAAMATPSYTAVFLPSDGHSVTYATGITGNQQIIGYSGGNTADALVWGHGTGTGSLLNLVCRKG